MREAGYQQCSRLVFYQVMNLPHHTTMHGETLKKEVIMIMNSKDNKITPAELAAMGITHAGYQAYLSACYTCTIAMIGIVLWALGGVS